MRFDFSAILLLAVVVTGLIWLIDKLFFATKRNADLPESEEEIEDPVLVDWSKSLFPIFLVVLVLRSFIMEPFRIPSGSMMPTLLVGDFILVNKYAYGVKFPVLNKTFIEVGKPKRGDVVVFRYPKDMSLDYIKRVIGEPGDKIGYYNKVIYVNGEPVPQDDKGEYLGVGAGVRMTGASLRHEQLENAPHQILVDIGRPSMQGEYIVPEGHYFVMGDNRDFSNDSRFWGMVPEANLVGKAFLVWMNWDTANGGPSWGRIGGAIK